MALSFLKTIEKPDGLRKIECLLSHITANKKLCKKNTIKTQTSCLHISFFIQIFCVSLHLGIKATLFWVSPKTQLQVYTLKHIIS